MAEEGVDATCALDQDAAALFGYAFDAYPMYGTVDADGTGPADLDECHGHTGPTEEHPEEIYHYHATMEFPNLPACLTGVVAEGNFLTTAKGGIGAAREPGQVDGDTGQRCTPPGFEDAAEALDVKPEALMQAVEAAGGPNLDFSAAAAALDVSEGELRDALSPPPR